MRIFRALSYLPKQHDIIETGNSSIGVDADVLINTVRLNRSENFVTSLKHL